MKCPKCGSENVNVQVVSETHLKQKHHSIIYWILIGWWLSLFLWVCLTLPKLIYNIFRPKKYKTKIINKSICVCQDCGYHWEVK